MRADLKLPWSTASFVVSWEHKNTPTTPRTEEKNVAGFGIIREKLYPEYLE